MKSKISIVLIICILTVSVIMPIASEPSYADTEILYTINDYAKLATVIMAISGVYSMSNSVMVPLSKYLTNNCGDIGTLYNSSTLNDDGTRSFILSQSAATNVSSLLDGVITSSMPFGMEVVNGDRSGFLTISDFANREGVDYDEYEKLKQQFKYLGSSGNSIYYPSTMSTYYIVNYYAASLFNYPEKYTSPVLAFRVSTSTLRVGFATNYYGYGFMDYKDLTVPQDYVGNRVEVNALVTYDKFNNVMYPVFLIDWGSKWTIYNFNQSEGFTSENTISNPDILSLGTGNLPVGYTAVSPEAVSNIVVTYDPTELTFNLADFESNASNNIGAEYSQTPVDIVNQYYNTYDFDMSEWNDGINGVSELLSAQGLMSQTYYEAMGIFVDSVIDYQDAQSLRDQAYQNELKEAVNGVAVSVQSMEQYMNQLVEINQNLIDNPSGTDMTETNTFLGNILNTLTNAIDVLISPIQTAVQTTAETIASFPSMLELLIGFSGAIDTSLDDINDLEAEQNEKQGLIVGGFNDLINGQADTNTKIDDLANAIEADAAAEAEFQQKYDDENGRQDYGDFKNFFDIFLIFFYLIVVAIKIMYAFYQVVLGLLTVSASTVGMNADIISGIDFVKNLEVLGINFMTLINALIVFLYALSISVILRHTYGFGRQAIMINTSADQNIDRQLKAENDYNRQIRHDLFKRR